MFQTSFVLIHKKTKKKEQRKKTNNKKKTDNDKKLSEQFANIGITVFK